MKSLVTMTIMSLTLWAHSCVFASHRTVELIHVNSLTVTAGTTGRQFQNVQVDILIDNLAFEKQVSIRELGPDGDWRDIPAYYVQSVSDNHELWRVEETFTDSEIHDLWFAVRYAVNGEVYWDNNYGQNYAMENNGGSFLNDRFFVYIIDACNSPDDVPGLNCRVALRNVAMVKDVNVVYSTDGWQTVQTAEARYLPPGEISFNTEFENPNIHNIEIWEFKVNLFGADTAEYAISYHVDGTTYWDNNFGVNYLIRDQ